MEQLCVQQLLVVLRTHAYLDIAQEYFIISLQGITVCPGVQDPRQLH
jgi:hypothetical protein